MSSLWQEAFDDSSQCTYYYNLETGETSWTLPSVDHDLEQEENADLSFMVFAVVRLQARLRGRRDRRRVARLVRARYETTVDPETHQTLYTDRVTSVSCWHPPALVSRLSLDLHNQEDDEDDDDDDDDVDFDAFQEADEVDDADGETGNGDEEASDGGSSHTTSKKRRTFPRSPAQLRVDAAEDLAAEDAVALDMSGLNAWKLSTRIWNLATLTRLSLAHNQLTRIPSGIQDLVCLEHLDVSHNQLTRLPSCLQTTATLRYLNASSNRITTFSPRLWKLRGLEELYLGWNLLHELPYVEGDLKLLRDTREWQVGVGLLGVLTVLDLSHNRLTSVPTSIEKCIALRVLDMSHNRLQQLTDEVGELHTLLELRVGCNLLCELPEAIGALGNLTTLVADANRLTTLPETIGNLQSLVELDLRQNQLHQLPEAFGALGHLQTLHLDGNTRLASLATCLRFLPAVESFSASTCGLVAFDSTDFLCNAPVKRLHLNGNSLLDFPVNLERSAMKTMLTELVLAQNLLRTFPMEIASAPCSALMVLDLSHNHLRVIPTEISRLRSLQSLVLSHNALGPSLPEAVAWLPQLRELRCDHNQLTTLPLAMGILKKLQHVDVGFNAIASLPTSFLDLVDSLRSLHVNDNQLTSPPPVVALLSQSCFVDLSNNPFCTGGSSTETQEGPSPQHLYAGAVRCFHEREYELAQDLLTRSLSLLESAGAAWSLRKDHLPMHLYWRGISRYMVVKGARGVIKEASETIEECEQQLQSERLVRQRAAYRDVKSHGRRAGLQKPSLSADEVGDRPESDNEASVSVMKRHERRASLVSNQYEDDEPTSERLQAAQQLRTDSRTKAAQATVGALDDLTRAIDLGVPELSTAYAVQGFLFMETLAFPQAIASFTHALDRLVATKSKPLPRTGVPLFMARAEAYRLLGQLPSALQDVERITESLALATPDAIVAKAHALADEWDVHQSQYFVDHESLFRAYDVASASGLPCRPEVHDLHAVRTLQQRQDQLNQTPTERFHNQIGALVREKQEAQAAVRRVMEAANTEKLRILSRARDFKRELRENLVMEMEEHTQRRVETELAKLAELKRQELDREFNERLIMAYEHEYMAWLVNEERRLEAERLRREDDARRRAEAKAQYETRLARRGGRRQQKATRSSPPKKGSR